MVSHTAGATGLDPTIKKFPWHIADRWIFVFMGVLFFATVMAGFIPTSISKLAAIDAGRRLPFPPVLHVHAVLMGSWILLLLTQVSLVATHHRALHQKLGLVALVLVPAMVITGFILVPVNFNIVWGLDPAIIPSEVIAASKSGISKIALTQIRVGILFPFFIGLALYYRRKDPESHKRLMFLATVLPMPAAFDRIAWLPSSLPASPATMEMYALLWILPLFTYDLMRYRRIPRAYIIWATITLPFMIVQYSLWSSPWWMTTVPKIMGVEPW